MSKESVAPAVSDINPPDRYQPKPRIITVTAVITLRTPSAAPSDHLDLHVRFGAVPLLKVSLTEEDMNRLLAEEAVALPVDVPAWSGSLFSEAS